MSDIVTAAGLSNDAFYRYFPSKGALVAALLERGTEQLRSYLAHQMDKESTPEGRIRRWVEGVLIQTQGDVAATTRAVMWNAPTAGSGAPYGRHFASEVLAALLHPEFAALGNPAPERNAMLVTLRDAGRARRARVGGDHAVAHRAGAADRVLPHRGEVDAGRSGRLSRLRASAPPPIAPPPPARARPPVPGSRRGR